MLVLRRSHAKSKNGCNTCKTRRVKCDEHRPCCSNCLRLNKTCDYPKPHASSYQASEFSYKWPDAAEKACLDWKFYGTPPFPFLPGPISSDWHHLPLGSLRYLYYLCSLAQTLEANKASRFCQWWEEFPLFLQVASKVRFAVHALIVISAKRLAQVTKEAGPLVDAAKHHALAVQGLRSELATFSRENADAVLAGSILLLFQQDTWSDWRMMMEGTSSVVGQMKPWMKHSVFSSAIENNPSPVAPSEHRERNLTRVSRDTLNFATFPEALESLFEQAIASLNRLASCINRDRNTEAATTVRGLRDLVRIVRDRRMDFKTREQFRLVYPYSTFMKPLSSSFLSINENEPFLIATLAHLFAVNILLGIVFPAINVPAFIPTQLRSLSAIGGWFKSTPRVHCDTCDGSHENSELITFPMNTVSIYQQWQKQF